MTSAPSTLWTEIAEQPAVMDRLVRDGGEAIAEVAERLRRRSDIRYVVIAARGSSDNAARYTQYLWGARNALTVALAAPSLFGAYAGADGPPPSLDGALVVGISQSGSSPDLVAVLREAGRQHRPRLVITNDPASALAAESEFVLELQAGSERAVAATKTYTAELVVVALLAATLARDDEMLAALRRLPGHTAWLLDQSERIGSLDPAFAGDRSVVLGRGFNHATAFEWALKLQELCAIAALPFSTADFEHGPIAAVGAGFPVFAVAPGGPVHRNIHRLLARLRSERGIALSVISDRSDTLRLADHPIALPQDVPEWLTPIVSIVAAQIVCHALALARGLDPDAPRGLRKVTRTR